MTDLPPRSPLPEPTGDEADLLASLYLDGEATAEERARVEADPELMARVEEFRALADEVATITVPAGLARTQISAALVAFDARHLEATRSAATDSVPTASTNVRALADRRQRRLGLPSWLGAAAGMVLVVGGLGFAATRGAGNDDEAASIETSVSASATNADRDASDDDSGDDSGDAGDADMAQESAPAAEMLEAEPPTEEMAEDGAEEAMEESEAATDEETPRSLSDDEIAAFWADIGPIDLSDYEAATATEFYEQLLDLPLQPIADSPCADSPLVDGLFGVDGFVPVVFEDQLSSLVVQEGAPATALIVGPTCEIELS